jgi:nitrogen fixation protein FixH
MKKNSIFFSAILLTFGLLLGACGSAGSKSATTKIADKKIRDSLTVTLSNADGKLKNGQQTVTLSFTDGAGKPVEMKAASLNFNMPAMGSMAEMNSAATLSTTATPGEFTGAVDLEMAGEWQAQISYEGNEAGKTTISLTAQ